MSFLSLFSLVWLAPAPAFGFVASISKFSLVTPTFLGGIQPKASGVTMDQEEDWSSSPSSESSYSSSRWDYFDYLQHWYPVCWKEDMPVGRPTKFTVFDQDYAVVLKDDDEVMGFVDRCPHRSAALSEGRLTTNGKYLQCAYHGWSFDSQGICRQIPQSSATSSYSQRTCADAVPALLHQGMVWLWPGPDKPNKLPPTIPELDLPDKFKVSRTVRDFPIIDWSLLLSNIMDPDHGIFAHQLAGFDMYSASKEYPMHVTEELDNQNNGWTLTSRVAAAEKLRARHFPKPVTGPTKTGELPTATTTFYAPTVVTIGRRDALNQTGFLTCFFVTPSGTGKSRFHSATASRAPFTLPRWFQHCFLNGFLDQDTVLVASQQPYTLSAEFDRLLEGTGSRKKGRQQLYSYQSPSDRAVRLVDAFWDATLSRVPNRVQRLREMSANGELRGIPSREVILDRASQHLNICKDSQDAVRNCQRISTICSIATAAWFLARTLSSPSFLLPRPLRSIAWPFAALLTGWIANSVRQRFYYAYSSDKRDRDLAKIPTSTWRDPE